MLLWACTPAPHEVVGGNWRRDVSSLKLNSLIFKAGRVAGPSEITSLQHPAGVGEEQLFSSIAA